MAQAFHGEPRQTLAHRAPCTTLPTVRPVHVASR
jgi:hypothetical protein